MLFPSDEKSVSHGKYVNYRVTVVIVTHYDDLQYHSHHNEAELMS